MAGLPWFKAYSLARDPRAFALCRKLSKPNARIHIYALRYWFAEANPSGIVTGANAQDIIEEAAEWDGESGAFFRAAVDAGFLREHREGGKPPAYFDDEWREQNAAHVAKVEKDRRKTKTPSGSSAGDTNPPPETPRNPPEPRAGNQDESCQPPPPHAVPLQTPRGESRELRVESRDQRNLSSSSAVASASAGQEQPGLFADGKESSAKTPRPGQRRSTEPDAPALEAAEQELSGTPYAATCAAMSEAFQQARGVSYTFDERLDPKALKWLIYGAEKIAREEMRDKEPVRSTEEIVRRFKIGLSNRFKHKANTFHALRNMWNDLAQPEAGGGAAPALRSVTHGYVPAETQQHSGSLAPVTEF